MGVDEFPLLSALGLYAADIRGDGELTICSLTITLLLHHSPFVAARSPVPFITKTS